MMDISKLQAFSHGFFQDILTLMKVLKKDTITKADIEGYFKAKLKKVEKGKEPKKKRRQFGKPIGNPKPFSEKKNVGCKECKDKEKAKNK